MTNPLPVPPEIWAEIVANEAQRLGVSLEVAGGYDVAAAYFPDYCTDSPGYHGPLVALRAGAAKDLAEGHTVRFAKRVPSDIAVWPAGPDAMSTFIRRDDRWTHCNSSDW